MRERIAKPSFVLSRAAYPETQLWTSVTCKMFTSCQTIAPVRSICVAARRHRVDTARSLLNLFEEAGDLEYDVQTERRLSFTWIFRRVSSRVLGSSQNFESEAETREVPRGRLRIQPARSKKGLQKLPLNCSFDDRSPS